MSSKQEAPATVPRQTLRSVARVIQAMGRLACMYVDGNDLVFMPRPTPVMLATARTFVTVVDGASVLNQLEMRVAPGEPPAIPVLVEPGALAMTINARQLGRVRRAVASQDLREALFSVLVDTEAGRLVASDGVRLHVGNNAVGLAGESRHRLTRQSFLLPASAARLMDLLRLEDVRTDGRSIVARRSEVQLIADTAPGQFPDCRSHLNLAGEAAEVRAANEADRILREAIRWCRSINASRPYLTIGAKRQDGCVLVASRKRQIALPWVWQSDQTDVPVVNLDPMHLRDALNAAGADAVIRTPVGEGPVIVADGAENLFCGVLQQYRL